MTRRARAAGYFDRPPNRARGTGTGERGDTLIELLVALTIIGIAFVGLLDGLTQGAMASGTHRSLTTLDGVLKSFAENGRYAIQQASPSSGSGPLYSQCATSYQFASSPYPRSGPAGTTVTVFGTGFTGSVVPTVTVGGLNATVTSTSTPSGGFGNLTTTFVVPSGGWSPGALLTVAITDGNTITAASRFTIASTASPDSVSSFQVGISAIGYWNSSGFGSCPRAGVSAGTDAQQITLTGTVPGASDQLSFVVVNPNHPLTPGVNLSAAPTSPYSGQAAGTIYPGQGITFTAQVNPPSSVEPTPTGTISWTVNGAANPSCPTGAVSPQTGNVAQATCSIGGGNGGQSYSVTASYSGTSGASSSGVYYVKATGSLNPPASVSPITPAVTVSYTGPASPTLGSNLTFVATVAPNPVYAGAPSEAATDSVAWSFPGGPSTVPTCSTSPTQTINGSTLQSTCTVTGAPAGYYQPTATFTSTSDPNYTGASASLPAASAQTVPKATPAVTVSGSPQYPAPGDTITFTATVSGPSGAPTPGSSGGSVTWTYSFNSGPATSCSSTTALGGTGNTATSTCTINSVTAGTYKASATYNSSGTNYNSVPAVAASLTVKAAPTMQVTGTTAGSTITFQATMTGPATGPTPTGTVTWAVVGSDGSTPSCSAPTQTGAANVLTATCTASGLSTTVTYTATATYPGDSNYGDATMSSGPVTG